MTTDPRLTPLRKLIADVAREIDGTYDENDLFSAPILAKLDDEAAEQIAAAVLAELDS